MDCVRNTRVAAWRGAIFRKHAVVPDHSQVTVNPETFPGHLRAVGTSRNPESGEIVSGVFTPVLAKHTKHLSLVDILSVGVDRMQRNFEPMRNQIEGLDSSLNKDAVRAQRFERAEPIVLDVVC